MQHNQHKALFLADWSQNLSSQGGMSRNDGFHYWHSTRLTSLAVYETGDNDCKALVLVRFTHVMLVSISASEACLLTQDGRLR